MKAKQKPGIVFQPHAHRTLQRGIDYLVNAISPTLGPLSGGVAIDRLNNSNHVPEYLDDGGVIARRIIELPDRDEDMGAMLLRGMLLRQSERVGDGVATAAVLFKAVFDAGLRYIAAGGNAMQLRRHLEIALPCVLQALDSMVIKLEGTQNLSNMAMSVCHDEALSALLGEAFDLIGEFGRLDIREDYGRVLERDYVEGQYYHTGLLSRAHLPEDSIAKVIYENPAIFLCDFEIEDHRQLFPILQTANAAKFDNIVIFARSLSEKAISLLVAQNKMDKFKVMSVQLPGMNPDDRMIALEDLSRLTGATPYIKVAGATFENVTAKDFGKARRFWANTRSFGLVGGGGDPSKLRQHIQTLKAHYRDMRDKDDRRKVQERIGNLLGGAVTIRIGGFTEPEIKNRKSIAERTALALRCAIQEGVVAGGGVALLNCRHILQGQIINRYDPDERAAYRIIFEALAAPARTLFQNAGYDPGDVMGQLYNESFDIGFDVLTNQVVNMYEAGILDSAQVLKATLRNAISTAAMALTIDSLVHLAKPEMIGNPE